MAVAAVAAHEAPATGYELSVYAASPVVFWAGIGIALATALVAGLSAGVQADVRRVSMVLAGAAVTLVVGLPVVRGYHFAGPADPLTHLGWAREIAAGTLAPADLLYPGVHTLAVFEAAVFGVPLTRAIEYAVVLFVVVFLLFVPLCVGLATGSRRGPLVGLFAALLLLPLNNVGTHLTAHPSSQAVLFLPFVLFLLFAHASREFGERSLGAVTATGGLAALAGTGLILVHPEEGLTLLAVLAAVVGVQTLARRYRPEGAVAAHRSLLPLFVVLSVVFLLWAPRHPRVQAGIAGVLASAAGIVEPGGEIASTAGSVAGVGGSFASLFVKLFLGSLLFSVLAAGLGLYSVSGRLDDAFPDDNALNKYLTVGMVPVVAGVVLLFLSAAGDHYFRYIGFGMVLVTLLGAAALTHLLDAGVGPPAARGTLSTVGVALLLVLTLATVHPSPFIFQSNDQISEAEYAGYESAFAARQPGVEFTGIRAGQGRYADAIYGPTSETAATFPGRSDRVPTDLRPATFGEFFDERRYVVITERDVERELVLYDGFRYSRETFATIRNQPGVARVESTGEFRLYYYPDESA